jgi:capsid portal protein
MSDELAGAEGANLPAPAGSVAFAFGDAVPVLDRREIFDLFEVANNGRWYEPPISQAGLGRCYRMAAHHQSAILLKRNLLVSSFVPSRWLSKSDFSRWALDWLGGRRCCGHRQPRSPAWGSSRGSFSMCRACG